MGGSVSGCRTTGTKRRYSESISESSSDHIHHSKRSSSAAEASSSTIWSEVRNHIDMDDVLVVEILCRLPSYVFVFQCKCVSKRWHALISDPYFIGRFLCVQRDHKEMPVKGTLIDNAGKEFLNRVPNLLSPLFSKMKAVHGNLVVVGTYNDLVLCCARMDYQRDYYICNPYTTEWVALPPPPQVYAMVAVGFMCDLPYYSFKRKDDDGIQLNDGFRCRVLRLVMGDCDVVDAKCKVEVFASETGQWIESIVSTSSVYGTCCGNLDYYISIAYNGMLYWTGSPLDTLSTFLIGLDPFMINATTGTGDDIYQCRFIQFEGEGEGLLTCSGVTGGCLRMWIFRCINSKLCLCVWDLNEEDDRVERLVIHAGDVKIDFQNTMRVYTLDGRDLLPGGHPLFLFSDLCNEDILYLHLGSDIIEYNTRTNEWSKINERRNDLSEPKFPVVLPWWPTPVPKLPLATCSCSDP